VKSPEPHDPPPAPSLDYKFRIIIILGMARQKTKTAVVALTRQRQVVLDAVQAGDHHPTAAEVFDAARQQLPGISFATVYNSLRFLRDEGLVHEIKFGDGASRYDRETDRHDHAICSECSKLVDFDLPGTVALIRAAARASKFKAESVHLTLVGLCPNCRDSK
jgi:Fur family transcriptional regulator, peroxide stress response regulator